MLAPFQYLVETIYLGIIAIVIGFILLFYWITKKPPKRRIMHEDHLNGGGIEKGEKRWLYFLLTIAIIGNLLTLSPLIPSSQILLWQDVKTSKTVTIEIRSYEFILPEKPIVVRVGEPIEFIVISHDLTYGFGVFRKDGSMVFQMQVVPKPYENRITWIFNEPGLYDIRSTEYSGPKHPFMLVKDAILVVGGDMD